MPHVGPEARAVVNHWYIVFGTIINILEMLIQEVRKGLWPMGMALACIFPCAVYMVAWSTDEGFVIAPELPVKFVKRLRDKIAMQKHRGHLECQVSRASARVSWYKNKKEITSGNKYEVRSEDVSRKLTINDVCSDDEDTYTCDAIDDKTSCKLLVEGKRAEDMTGTMLAMPELASNVFIWSKPYKYPDDLH